MIRFAGEPLNWFEGRAAWPSIFLAGPTSRSQDVPSWRLELARHINTNEVSVVVPEPRLGSEWPSPVEQHRWEWEALRVATVIAFWVPRNMQTLPGLTTNIEFGLWARSGKVVFGAPEDAEHVGYMRRTAKWLRIPTAATLTDLCDLAIERAKLRDIL